MADVFWRTNDEAQGLAPPGWKEREVMAQPWHIHGELIINCNCPVFCPCVLSLGHHAPTEGYCHAWGGVHIEEGAWGGTTLDGLNVAFLLDIPGRMTDGNWSMALYLDANASSDAVEGLTHIFSGHAGGTAIVFHLLVSTLLGVKTVPIAYEKDGNARRFTIPHILDGTVEAIRGKQSGEPVMISNSGYWISPNVMVCQGGQSKIRDFGRVWDLSGKSAEICQIQWSGA